MRVAVITPYYRESDEMLCQCLDSVAQQTYSCTHMLVADGFPRELVARRVREHFILPQAHADIGNLARCVGALSAASRGFDAIAFLDADNWYQADHVASLVELQRRTDAAVCTSARSVHRLDGSLLIASCHESNGRDFADTSTLFFHRKAFHLLPLWAQMPRELGPLGDRIMWAAIAARKLARAHSHLPTLAFRTQYSAHYWMFGEAPPPGTKPPNELKATIALWNAMPSEERRRLLFGA